MHTSTQAHILIKVFNLTKNKVLNFRSQMVYKKWDVTGFPIHISGEVPVS
jgi:hypothetical protein